MVDAYVSAHNDDREPRRLKRPPMAAMALEETEGQLIRADRSDRPDGSEASTAIAVGGIGATTSLAGRIGANTGHMTITALQAFYTLYTTRRYLLVGAPTLLRVLSY